MSSPHYVIYVFRKNKSIHVWIFIAELMFPTLAVHGPTIGGRTHKVYSIVHSEIYQRLGEVVERLPRQALHHEHLPTALAYAPADRLSLRFIFHQRAIVHKGILTEKTATSLHRPVKKVCVPGHTYVYLAIHTGTISQLGHTSRKGFTVDDKGTYNLTVVGSYVGRLRHIYYSGILNIELSPM